MAVLNSAQRSILYMAVALASGTDVCPDGVGCYNNDVKRVGECLLSPPTPHTTAVSPATAITSVRSTQKERFTLRQKDFPFIAVSQQQNMLQRNVFLLFSIARLQRTLSQAIQSLFQCPHDNSDVCAQRRLCVSLGVMQRAASFHGRDAPEEGGDGFHIVLSFTGVFIVS